MSTKTIIAMICGLSMAGLGCAFAGQSNAAQQNMQNMKKTPMQTMHHTDKWQNNSHAQSKFATVNGMKIHYRVSGKGEPLLLIHGYPLDGMLFSRVAQTLSQHYKVIAPDLPGFGKSSAKQGQGSLKMYAKLMFGLMNKLGIQKAVIGGHSMGGMTTLEMYKEQPGRFDGMILIDTAAIAAPLPRKQLWMGYAQLAKKSGNHTKTMDKLLIPNMLSDHTRMHDQKTVMAEKKMIKQASKAGVVQGGEALADRPSYTNLLGQIKVPTLIIVGSEDTITPMALAKNMHSMISGSKLAIIDGASHTAVFEKPRKVGHAILMWVNPSPRTASTGQRH